MAASTKEAAGFGDDLGLVEGEEFVEDGADGGGEFFEGEFAGTVGLGGGVSTSPTTTEVEESHLVAELVDTVVEEITGILEGGVVGGGVAVARTDVEGDTDDVDTDFLGEGHQVLSFAAGAAELAGELADGAAVISLDAEDSFSVRHVLLDLEQLVLVVEGGALDTEGFGLLHVVGLLARVGEDDLTSFLGVLGVDGAFGVGLVDDVGAGVARVEDLLDFAQGGTVEGATKSGDHGDDGFGVVALDGVVDLDTREVLLELGVLHDDLAKIDNVEGLRGIFRNISSLGGGSLVDEGGGGAAAVFIDVFGDVAGHFDGVVVAVDVGDAGSAFDITLNKSDGILELFFQRSAAVDEGVGGVQVQRGGLVVALVLVVGRLGGRLGFFLLFIIILGVRLFLLLSSLELLQHGSSSSVIIILGGSSSRVSFNSINDNILGRGTIAVCSILDLVVLFTINDRSHILVVVVDGSFSDGKSRQLEKGGKLKGVCCCCCCC